MIGLWNDHIYVIANVKNIFHEELLVQHPKNLQIENQIHSLIIYLQVLNRFFFL